MKVQFPKDVTSFGYGEKQYAVSDGNCEIPDTEPEAIRAAQDQAASITLGTQGLQESSSALPAGQGQEFARALLRELLTVGAPQRPTQAPLAGPAPKPADPKAEISAPEALPGTAGPSPEATIPRDEVRQAQVAAAEAEVAAKKAEAEVKKAEEAAKKAGEEAKKAEAEVKVKEEAKAKEEAAKAKPTEQPAGGPHRREVK